MHGGKDLPQRGIDARRSRRQRRFAFIVEMNRDGRAFRRGVQRVASLGGHVFTVIAGEQPAQRFANRDGPLMFRVRDFRIRREKTMIGEPRFQSRRVRQILLI